MNTLIARLDEPDQTVDIRVERDGEDIYVSAHVFFAHLESDPDAVVLLSAAAAQRLGRALINAAGQVNAVGQARECS
jgi:hypothetical protein